MRKVILIAAAVSFAALAIEPISTNAQTPSDVTIIRTNNTALNRAKNLARQAAVDVNGGLGEYRAEDAMHGPAAEAPYEDNEDGTWTFTFLGRRPNSTTYTIETVVTVSADGSRVSVDYNGPIRDPRRTQL